MTKTESAEKLIKTLVIESCEQLLDFHGAEGVRAAIPNTKNLIMVGTPEWIAKNVPGVEAVGESVLTKAAMEQIAESWDGCVFDGIEIGDALRRDFTRLAATTQASTAQAERNAALEEAALLCEQIGTDWLDADDAHKQFAADYLAKAIRALRAGDTGEQADGGATDQEGA